MTKLEDMQRRAGALADKLVDAGCEPAAAAHVAVDAVCAIEAVFNAPRIFDRLTRKYYEADAEAAPRRDEFVRVLESEHRLVQGRCPRTPERYQ